MKYIFGNSLLIRIFAFGIRILSLLYFYGKESFIDDSRWMGNRQTW
jgi:hypothetical protein